MPWKILKYSERLKMTKYLSRACSAWVKDGQLKAPVYNVIKVCIWLLPAFCLLTIAMVGISMVFSCHIRVDKDIDG